MTCLRVILPGQTTGLLCSEIEKRRPDPDCPNADQHTPHPEGYNQHANWAEQMLTTHRQERCEGCGNLNVWVPNGQVSRTTEMKPSDGPT